MKRWSLIASVFLGGLCSCASPTNLPNTQSASERWSTLGYREKFLATDFYNLGAGDTVRRLYWNQRRSQQYSRSNDAQSSGSTPTLQRRYVNVPIEPHQDPDGTLKEGSTQAIEVVY
jgi:hypothetical protein